MLTHHCCILKRKFTVPSSGSTTQRSPLEPSWPPLSSPGGEAVLRTVRCKTFRDHALGHAVGLADETWSGCSCCSTGCAPPSRKLSSSSAPAAGLGPRANPRAARRRPRRPRPGLHARPVVHACSVVHARPAAGENCGGRSAAQGRSASIWAASASSVASPLGAPHELHRARQALRGEARGHRAGGLAGGGPAGWAGARWPRPQPSPTANRAAPLAGPDRWRRGGRDRGQEHVVLSRSARFRRSL